MMRGKHIKMSKVITLNKYIGDTVSEVKMAQTQP